MPGADDEVARKDWCDPKDTTNAKVLNYIDKNRAAAGALASETGLNADFILAWAGLESGFGADPDVQNNNYFGLTTDNWPGAIGCPSGSDPGYACFSEANGKNLLNSGRSALSSNNGRYLTPALAAQNSGGGIADIARAIANAGFNTYFPDNGATYASKVVVAAGSIQLRSSCPK